MSTLSSRDQRRQQYGESQLEPPLGQEYDREFRPPRTVDLLPSHKASRPPAELFGTALGYMVAVGVGGTLGLGVTVAALIGVYAGIRELIRLVWGA